MTAADSNKVECADNEFFKKMLDLIPATFYFDQDAKAKLAAANPLDESSTEAAAGTRGSKRGGKQLSKKAQLKRARFDPENALTVTRTLELIHSKNPTGASSTPLTNGKSNAVPKLSPADDAAGSTDLHSVIQGKIAAIQAKRKGMGKEESIEKKRLRRQESKMKLKLKRKAEKTGNVNKGDIKPEKRARAIDTKPAAPTKPVYNKEGKLVFTKFDFSETPSETKNESGGKNFKKLLEKVKADKAHIKDLKSKDLEQGHQVEEKAAWQKALARAEGQKVRDDPELLKKSIKKQEKKKQKSTKDWDERNEKVEKKVKERQEKRQRNIKSKKDKRGDAKLKKMKKKGHILPGF